MYSTLYVPLNCVYVGFDYIIIIQEQQFQKGLDEDLTIAIFSRMTYLWIYSWERGDVRRMANASDGNSEDGLLLDSEILSEQDELDEFDSSEKSHTMTFKCCET